ncbi:tetratricopeptide repeat protein [Streptomyces mobaraensis]|uniref:NB-ARC domain-containing protein n=1 Tax=Streptomyces mobaraensis (strain ATCC 29032 / DSM 40847 / JCM 4168 / NBRC 13819 / NCIMB 11159 / IPCR 16-22) TaxID=1223523 RepID=M3BYZ9_STRM1|nr:NB-ARC domain-containing protein [Streptomyces mobaraensis NBRC 13819 = DSM 40847]
METDNLAAVHPERVGPGVRPRRPDAPVTGVALTGAGLFTGRDRELKELRADIARTGLDTLSGRKPPRSRVLLIAGRPGSGRTALAEELARRLERDYPDGVLRARLTDADGTSVPTDRTARALLADLGATATAPAGAEEDELTAALRAALAGRRVLLLLDDASGAASVEPLLPDEPGCLVVAVARGPLTGVTDVRPCTLGGLETAAAVDLLEWFAGPTRITCDPMAASAVVEECAGQPAALVLVGGWLAAHPKMSVADAARRLRELPVPAGHDGTTGRPLARALWLAYEALPALNARILRLLALAPAGPADAHTASALAGCSVSAAQAALDDFVARGLLRPVPVDGVPGAPGALPPQYQVPGCLAPLLRALLETQDRPAEVELARARMLERVVRQLHSCRAAAELTDPSVRRRVAELPRPLRFPSARVAEEWLRSRLPALLAAARLAVEDGGLDTLARRLVSALTRALSAHLPPEEAGPEQYGLHRLVLDVADRREMALEKSAALLNLGDLDTGAGRVRMALDRYREALQAARACGDPYATSRSMESIAASYQELADWARATDWYRRALELRLTRGELADEARLYGRLGAVHALAGEWGEALRTWRAASAACRRLRDLPGHARALSEAAVALEHLGRPQDAVRTGLEAAEGARRAGDGRLEAAVRLRLADTLDRLADPAGAEAQRRTAEGLLREPAGPVGAVETAGPMGTAETVEADGAGGAVQA